MGWHVYVIECESGAWYTGVTKDLRKRFQAHVEGRGAKFMRMDKPKRMVAAHACASRGEAQQLEAAVKALDRDGKRGWIQANPWRDEPA